MALIGEIRKHSWLLIVLIGLAMAGFIFMDMFSGDRSIFSNRQTIVGEVNGEPIDYREFERSYSALYGNSGGDAFQQRQQMWNYLVEQHLMRDEAREIGLYIPVDELDELVYGPRLSPIIQQRFQDPNTRQVNMELLNQYRTLEENGQLNDPNVVDVQRRDFWYFQKSEIHKQRLQDKLAGLLAKSMYTPDWMAEEIGKGQQTRIDLAYVRVPYEAIPETSVALTDGDFDAFLTEFGPRLRSDKERRSIAYATLRIDPTAQDRQDIQRELAKLREEWTNARNDSMFVTRNRGTYSPRFVPDQQLNNSLQAAQVGDIVGPYIDGNRYTIAKIIERKPIADSVRSRHILLPLASQEDVARTPQLADSLINLIKTGAATFDELARQYSTGPTSTKGGDLGFAAPGMMVGPFNDLIFYQAKEGDINTVVTQFGYHIVEVTDRKFTDSEPQTRIATISKDIVPSARTQKERYALAARFAQENRTVDAMREAAMANPDVAFNEGIVVNENDFSAGELEASNSSRDIVKYAFANAPGSVSPTIYSFTAPDAFYEDRYVVAAVAEKLPPGIPTVSSVKGSLRPLVLREKKAALIQDKNLSLSALAAQYGVQVDTARGINFNAGFIPGIGSEPRALARAFTTPDQQTTAAVAGNSGVLVMKPISRVAPSAQVANVASIRQQEQRRIDQEVRSRLGYALREDGDVVDERSRFY